MSDTTRTLGFGSVSNQQQSRYQLGPDRGWLFDSCARIHRAILSCASVLQREQSADRPRGGDFQDGGAFVGTGSGRFGPDSPCRGTGLSGCSGCSEGAGNGQAVGKNQRSTVQVPPQVNAEDLDLYDILDEISRLIGLVRERVGSSELSSKADEFIEGR